MVEAVLSPKKQVKVQEVLKSNKQFKDPHFKAEESSLFNSKKSKLTSSEQKEWKALKWQRPNEFFGSFKVFEAKIEASDIKQGDLGNCYFLSALAALTEFPQFIRKVFSTPEPNEVGCYEVSFCLNGEQIAVAIDDFFPCKDDKPAFSQCNGNEIWVLILEKAWAKVCGNYESTVIGYTSEALRSLTGAPIRFLDHEFEEDIWSLILEADKNNQVICCSAGKPNFSTNDY